MDIEDIILFMIGYGTAHFFFAREKLISWKRATRDTILTSVFFAVIKTMIEIFLENQ